jgi:hypothetical protein
MPLRRGSRATSGVWATGCLHYIQGCQWFIEVFYLLTKVDWHHTTAYGHIQWKLDFKFILEGADLNTKLRTISNTGNFTETERKVRENPYIKEYHMGFHCIINKIYVDTETDISHTWTLQNR